MSRILIKMPMKPHRQKVLTPDGQEVRLQQFANRMAANELRGAGGDAQGEQFTSSRDKLMRDMVANPESHNIKFMGERVPFEGQNLEESLSMPDVAGEQAAIDGQFAGEAEGQEGTIPNETQEDIDADKKRFNPDREAEHMRRIMTSRQVPMRDAWSILKEMPQCKVCQGKLEEVHPGGGEMVCMNANCPARMMTQSEGQPSRLRFPAEMFPTGGFNSLEEMTENARNNPDYSKDLYY